MANLRNNQKLLWILAIGAWMLGCAILLLGGGIWLGRQTENNGKSTIAEITSQLETQMEEETPTTLPTNTPLPASTTLPTDTPTPEESNEEKADNQSGNEGIESQSDTSSGDHLVLPTATPTSVPEGVIIFLSSRYHDGETRDTFGTALEIYAMETDGSNPIRISDTKWEQGDYLISLKHDEEISIIRQQLFININGNNFSREINTERAIFNIVSRQLNNVGKLSFSSGGMQINPANLDWASDGSMVFSGFENFSLYYLSNSQSNLQQLTFHPISQEFIGDNFPVFSPDGQWIAFSRDTDDVKTDGIWVMKTDSTDAHLLIARSAIDSDGINHISWSPDGTHLAFQAYKSRENNATLFDLWASNIDGDELIQLVSATPKKSVINRPIWLPDSKKIIFDASDTEIEDLNLFVTDFSGGTPLQLTTEGQYNGSPIWLPISMDELLANAPTPAPPTATPKPVVAAPPPAPLNCPSPGVQITSPRSGARFTDRYNYIVGTANINSFHHWKMEYSTDPNGGWQYLLERDYPVDNDKLVMIDASTIPNGPYGLRLTVVDATGNYPQPCEIWFTNGY